VITTNLSLSQESEDDQGREVRDGCCARTRAGVAAGPRGCRFPCRLNPRQRAPATVRSYRGDLASVTAHHRGPPESITPKVLRGYFATLSHLAPDTRGRRQATLASFLRWAYRQDLIAANPVDKLDRVRLPAPAPRGLGTGRVAAILAVIPRHRLRDRVLCCLG
jgi:site-specific recombinase XerD